MADYITVNIHDSSAVTNDEVCIWEQRSRVLPYLSVGSTSHHLVIHRNPKTGGKPSPRDTDAEITETIRDALNKRKSDVLEWQRVGLKLLTQV